MRGVIFVRTLPRTIEGQGDRPSVAAVRAKIVQGDEMDALLDEAAQLRAIFQQSVKTAKAKDEGTRVKR
jgi:hypothetical protein